MAFIRRSSISAREAGDYLGIIFTSLSRIVRGMEKVLKKYTLCVSVS